MPASVSAPATRTAPSRARSKASPNDTNGKMAPSVARIMARYTPAFAIIDRQQAVQEFSGPVAKFLEPASGVASLKLSTLLLPSLRAPLRDALKEATASQRRVVNEGLVVEVAGRDEAINLVV